jgi:hypothetical protein
MNELAAWLTEQPNSLSRALEQSGGPTLLWIANERDRSWLAEILPRLGALGGLLGEARLPRISRTTWDGGRGTQRPGQPDGSWLAFLESNGQGLIVPDDSGPRCWSVLSLFGNFWLPWRLYFGPQGRSLDRVEVDPSACMAGEDGNCIPLDCDGNCQAEEYVTPYPCRKCVCRPRQGS